MNHNIDSTTETGPHGNGRMKTSFRRGTETWFDVDDITIHFWGSNWTGREIVTVRNGGEARVVSDVRSLRFKTLHEFDHDGHRYGLNFAVGLGKAELQLYRDGELIDSDLVDNSAIRVDPQTGRVDWGYAMKKLAAPLLGGAAFGAVIGYVVATVLK